MNPHPVDVRSAPNRARHGVELRHVASKLFGIGNNAMNRPPPKRLLQHRLPAPGKRLGRADRDAFIRQFDGEDVVVLRELERERFGDAFDLDLQRIDPEIRLIRRVRQPVAETIEVEGDLRILGVRIALIRNQFERVQVNLVPAPRDREQALGVALRDSAVADELIEHGREIQHAIGALRPSSRALDVFGGSRHGTSSGVMGTADAASHCPPVGRLCNRARRSRWSCDSAPIEPPAGTALQVGNCPDRAAHDGNRLSIFIGTLAISGPATASPAPIQLRLGLLRQLRI